jgi:hypothetical protein
MIKQPAIAALILISVTILSLGIRYVRLSANRANTIENSVTADTEESTPYTRPSNPQNGPKSEQTLGANTEPNHYPKDSQTIDAKPNPQQADATDSDEDAPWNYLAEAKPFKGDYAKSEGSKDLEKISLSDYENLYITAEGELWYVSKEDDGSIGKIQVQIDEATGEFTAVGSGYYAKSEGSQGLQRISVGENEDLYLTGENELWYVGEQPDGSTAKMQLQTENINGGMTIVGSGEMNIYPADGGKSDED